MNLIWVENSIERIVIPCRQPNHPLQAPQTRQTLKAPQTSQASILIVVRMFITVNPTISVFRAVFVRVGGTSEVGKIREEERIEREFDERLFESPLRIYWLGAENGVNITGLT